MSDVVELEVERFEVDGRWVPHEELTRQQRMAGGPPPIEMVLYVEAELVKDGGDIYNAPEDDVEILSITTDDPDFDGGITLTPMEKFHVKEELERRTRRGDYYY